MKRNAFLTAAVAAALWAGPALAKEGVASRYDQWEQRLRSRVTALHVFPADARPNARGDVLVSFRMGSDGNPSNITIRRSSGEAAFDEAAVLLVSRLGRLGPVPAKGRIGEVTLKLSYGEPSRQLAKDDREERIANERRNRLVVSQATRVAEKR